MKTTVTEYHCDICKQKILKEEDVHFVEVVVDGQPYEFHWDTGCFQQLLNHVNGDPDLACKVPGCGFVAKTEGGLEVHKTRKHADTPAKSKRTRKRATKA